MQRLTSLLIQQYETAVEDPHDLCKGHMEGLNV